MANTIRIGTFEVSHFKVGLKDPKIYLGDILLYPTGGYKVCYAVVDDITQYSDTEFEDVYDKATDKWFKLNNLNQYEQYGIYGSGRNVTTYEGKLTIDGDYEYQYSGGSWVNVGEVSGSTIDTIWLDPSATNALFNIGHYWGENYKMIITTYLSGSYSGDFGSFWQANGHTPIELSFYSNGFYYDMHNPTSTTAPNVRTTDYDFRILNQNTFINYQNSQVIEITLTYGSFKAELADSGTLIYSDGSTKTGYSWYSGLYQANIGLNNANAKCHLSHIQIYNGNNELVNDFKFIKNNGVVGSQEISIYDSVTNTTYTNTNSNTPVYHIVSDSGGTEYPIYYSEKSDPLDNLTFNTLEDAQAYAEANCVYDGMHATIGTDRYYFDSTDENGWVKILEYYKFEDVTSGGASGWTISGSATYNPDSSYYDDFDLETTSTSNVTKIAKVTIYGYDHFTYYLRTTGRTSYCYAVATNVDEIQTPPSTMSYNSSSAITNTYYWNKSPKSAVNLSNYRRVTYNNLDKTVEHTFYVYFYGRTNSSYVGNATILIPKEQTNENWEQVTFSASSNVASSYKSLYIDGNNTTSGGTQYWYYRWMIGLPSGSHTSYTNYSSFDYCPNVTSSTFTSVAGNSRQVNFTYNNTSTKTLSFRLVDSNGNILTPSDTVYYNMVWYNSCNAATSESNKAFPLNKNVKVGGSFRFNSSSNRHYIYGYSPNISLNYDYYVNNYQSTFDITYTKLSEEAVTITYTTYDPSDVETPAFNTDITYPYSGGTTSSTTLTSYAVPYTYPYKVSQTSNKFSADSQSYTANQAARTINFVLYPNNREFATVADMEAYQYAWEGMKAKVDDTNYKYENGEWVEKTSKDSDFVIGDFNTFVSSSTEVTEGYYIIYNYSYDSSYANKNYLFSWNSGNTWSGYYTLGNMNHSDSNTSVPISSSEIIDDAVWELKDAGNGNFYIRNVGTNKYWYYLGSNTNYGVPLTDNVNDAIPVNIQDWRSCLAFVEKINSYNYPINRLYSYSYRYGWHNGGLGTDGNNQYYMRKYVP